MMLISLLGGLSPAWSQVCSDVYGEIQTKRFTSVGFGTSTEEWASVGQRQLIAIQSAKRDAYQTMAEQVYGFRLKGATTVSGQTVKSDRLKIDVDPLVRGAYVVSVQPIADDVYEVRLAMNVPLDDEQLEKLCDEVREY